MPALGSPTDLWLLAVLAALAGALVAGVLAAQFTYRGRVQPTDIWQGDGREYIWRGTIPYEELGDFERIPWSAYGP